MYQSVGGVIVFIANNPVRPVHSAENQYLSRWYLKNSLVFVSHTHSLWLQERKTSKRYGSLRKSPASQLQDMAFQHREEVTRFIAERAGHAEGNEEDGTIKSEEREDIVMTTEK